MKGTGTSQTPGTGSVTQAQQASNGNQTSQSADSKATQKQTNINAPVSILSSCVNGGQVDQTNNGTTEASSGNTNSTGQGNTQTQDALSALTSSIA